MDVLYIATELTVIALLVVACSLLRSKWEELKQLNDRLEVLIEKMEKDLWIRRGK